MKKTELKLLTEINDASILSELKTFPNQSMIWGMIENANKIDYIFLLPSKQAIILIDLQQSESPFIFIAGNATENDIITSLQFCKSKTLRLYCHQRYHQLLLARGWNLVPRISLKFTNNHILKDSNLDIKPIDNKGLLKRCLHYKVISPSYLTNEDFIKSNYGYVVESKNKIICEGYLCCGNSYAEIGIITCETYRKQGIATQVACFLVNKAKEMNLMPIWSCDYNNQASLASAFKLGFIIDKYYIQMMIKKL